ncbi:hypothetical protein JVX90_18285 [Gordonia sp. PDNC005]|jgi:hypothetical protein|uniref:hypothetical protein n=1 Tax=unclassified Gordonia (in: high G+C Gram-positive bacteria) TaxID=2657482 RepID=UPI001962853B|nr:hypothetical protein [Gordonia sp. PDNC005]QRY62303.1 hypothetical protein JVX90_18285 [Gordonia sp. PDNC005]
MDPVIEYGFGTGDGDLSSWRSPADLDLSGDGLFDAVALDFDGDGRVDDAMWDSDGDGVADRSALDLDDNGHPDSVFTDGGKGLWERPADSARTVDRPRESSLDTDGDSSDDTVLIDSDGDGYADTSRPIP